LVPLTVALLSVLVGTTYSWNQDSVLLRDIQALTFYKNRYTTARRSSPVPQLKCVGGSAGCHAFIPEVVQCVNRGWDGVDVQVPIQAMVSVVIILMDNVTKEVALVLAQAEASGLEWEQEECWDIFLVVRG
ncbi:hypothetical protein XENOCAPTIV_003911, partial [Xenoophorus captivus]